MVRPDSDVSSTMSESDLSCPKRGSEKENKDTPESDGVRGKGSSDNFAESKYHFLGGSFPQSTSKSK